ncbi:TPA: hypothetical protein ACH3X3_014555 [Trebouxia sp. C0006]
MVKSTYLLIFNITVVCGWAYVLFLCLIERYNGGDLWQVWKAIETPLKLTQTAALLEVAHSVLGVVRAPVMTTVLQVTSRVWVVWGIMVAAPAQIASTGVTIVPLGKDSIELNLMSLLLAWSITEIVRYSFFAFKELGMSPYPLLWLRYTTFIPLYPLGVASEMTMVALALPHIRKSQMWSIRMPNAFNFAFDYFLFCLLAVAIYIPGFPMLYLHMLSQRKKVLGKPKAKLL